MPWSQKTSGNAMADNEVSNGAEVTTASFRQDVIATSARQPVIVEFWSSASAASAGLTASLSRVVAYAEGRIKLARLDVEAYPEIASQLGVQTIPATIVFQKGQPIDGFTGFLSDEQIRGFLERLIGPIGGELDDQVRRAQAALEAGQTMEALASFNSVLESDPSNEVAVAGLVRAHLLSGDAAKARSILNASQSGAGSTPGLKAARAALENAEHAASLGDIDALAARVKKDQRNFHARLELAIAFNARGERNEAADQLLSILRADREWSDGAARKQLLQFFEEWGFMDPETLAARRQLSSLLFS